MKRLSISLALTGALLLALGGPVLVASPAEARGGPRGGNFWGGFAAGALTGALLRPPVFVAGPPVVAPHPRAWAPRRAWVPGAYVVRYRPCGTPYRVWRRGYWAY